MDKDARRPSPPRASCMTARPVREARRHESGNVHHRKNWPCRHRRRVTGAVLRQIEEAVDIADAAEVAHSFPPNARTQLYLRGTR
jgi:hypothetical protein